MGGGGVGGVDPHDEEKKYPIGGARGDGGGSRGGGASAPRIARGLAAKLEIAANKVTYYLETTLAEHGFGKVGFSMKDKSAFEQFLRAATEKHTMGFQGITDYGTKYNQVFEYVGANGVKATIQLNWQIDKGTDILRFIGGWAKEHK
jgi:hypothetical protein